MKTLKSIAALLFVASAAMAQTTEKLTLDNAIQLALKNSKQLKLSAAKTAAADVKVTENKNAFIPTVSINSGYTRLSDNIEPFVINIPGFGSQSLNPQILNQYTNRASISSTLFNGLRNQNALKTTKYLDEAAKLDAEKDATEVRFNTISAVLNLYKGQQTLLLIAENTKLSESRINDITNMYNAGTALENDVLRTALVKTNLEISKMDVESAISTAYYNLSIMLGLEPGANPAIDETSLFAPAEQKSNEEWIKEAITNRGDKKAAENRALATKYGISNAQSGYMPALTAGFNYYYNRPNQRIFPQTDQFNYTWDLGLTFSWNLTGLYTSGAYVKEAKINYEQSNLTTAIIDDNIKMEVNANYNAYNVARAKIDAAEKGLNQAKENQRVTKNKVDSGYNLQTDLLDADAFVMQGQINLLNANVDAQVAYFKLLKSVGR